jgi:FtsP/CotA-like multicopper oxidase with cupredoxin domain
MRYFVFVLFLSIFAASLNTAWAAEYSLNIARETVNITGHPVKKITVNGTIPAPTLRFMEGEEAVIHVTNHMDEPTSVHWHGILIPNDMDGVPGLGGYRSIAPGQTFTYRFKIRQTGTYWYHAHTVGQEQDGLYGSLIFSPSGTDPIRTDRDYVVVLSDFTDEESSTIMSHLKMSSDYYSYARRTVGDFFYDVHKKGFSKAWSDAKDWGQMRMSPTDLSDVSGYTFLMNGKTPQQNWTGLFKPGQRVRLRFINASSMSFYDVRIPGLKMTMVQADGQNVEPVKVDEFRMAVAETYDVVVTPEDDKAYTIAAESIDRTGFAIGTLATQEGMKGQIPAHRPRALLTMGDMGGMMDMSGMTMTAADMKSGWADVGTPPGDKALSYADLRYSGTQKDTRPPEREINVTLGGNMERYIWTMNGKKYEDAEPIQLKYGERVRLKFTNETMMAHPMHLHGMFVQLENGQPAEKLPNKHTIIIPPGQSYSVLLTADEPGEWAFHCHLLFHMLSGMMNKVVVAKLDPSQKPLQKPMPMNNTMPMNHDVPTEGGSHDAH